MNTNEPICTGCGHPRSRAIKAVIEGCVACCPDCDVLGMDDRNLIREVVALTDVAAMREAIKGAAYHLRYIANEADAVWDARDEARLALSKLKPFVSPEP